MGLEELMMQQLKNHEAATYVVSNEVSDTCRLLQGQMAAVMENMAGLTSEISRLAESLERFKTNSAEQWVFFQSLSASGSSRDTEQGQLTLADSAKVAKLPAKNTATISTSPIQPQVQSRSSNMPSTVSRGTLVPGGLSSMPASKTVMPQTSTGASVDSSPPFAGLSCDVNASVTPSPSVASAVRVLESRAASVRTSPKPRQILPMMSLGEANVAMLDRGVPQFFLQAHTPKANLQSGTSSVQNFVQTGNPNVHSNLSPDVSSARASSPTPPTASRLLVSPMHNKEPTTTSVSGPDQRCTEKVPPLGLVDVPPAIFTCIVETCGCSNHE